MLVGALPGRTSPAATCPPTSHAPGRDHLARCDRGTSVRVSSVDRTLGHELQLIDGVLFGHRHHWRSSRRDARPTIELAFASPRAITGLALHRARRSDALAALDVRIHARTADGWRDLGMIRDDTRSVARWLTKPVDVTALRLELTALDGQPIGLDELEVLGALAEPR